MARPHSPTSPDHTDAIAFFIVSIQNKKSKKVRVNITVPEDDLHLIDSFAKQQGMSRSAFLLKAAQSSIHQTQPIS